MKKLLVLAALLGITFYYNVDLEFGWAWINSSLEHYTVVEQSSVNTVTIYRSDGWHLKMTLEDYIQMEGKKTLKAIK